MAKKTADGGGSATSPAAVFRDVTARDITLQFGLTSAPATYRSLIRRFLRAYLGSPEAPVPFGGRDAQIAELNQWLADPDASSNLCVTAPAGRGKTALLVRWLGQVDREAWPVAFVPISMRYETNRAATFYQALAARLAEILGEALPTTPADPASFYRDKVIEYLDLFYEKDRRCLVVIDGLDEAAGWQADTSVLPLDPAPGLRIVASARLLAGDRGSADWLRRLGWSARQEMAQTLEVRLLDRDGIADVLEKMGYPLAPLSGQVDVLAELLRLTAGEPLLLELYMRALLERGDRAARLRAEELRDLKPGFAGYFKTWWEQQRRAWHDEGSAVDEQTVQAILAVLACALGPLTLSDLAHLIREIHGVDRIVSADSLHPIRRFVIGDGVEVGYSFSHPKLADYFRDEHFGTGEVIHQTRAGFVEWGRKTVRALNEGVLAPSENPGYRYLLDHYSQHLRQEDEPPEQFVELVEDGWRRAWETYEGGFQGFASAVQVAWDTLKETRQTNRWVSLSPSRCLGAEIRCALSLSSLCSLGSNMPMTLLDAALAAGRISSPQALHLAELETNPLKRVQKLLAIRRYLREPQHQETLAAALSMARAIEYPSARAQALIEVIPHLSATRRGEVVDAALDAARAVQDPASRAQRLIAVAPHLPEAQRQEVLADALAVAGTVEAPTQRVPIIAALAPQLPEFLLQRAFTAVEAIDGDWLRARALSALVPRLPEALLGNALDAAWAMDDPSARAEALIALAPRLPEPRRLEVLAGALAAAGAVEKPLARAAALAALAPQVPEALLPDALAAAKALERCARATALPPFAQRLPEVQRKEIFSEALDSAQAVKNPRYRVKVLIAVSAHLTGEERDRALTAGLDAVKAINNQSHRAQSLISLAPHLPESGLPDALAVATTVGDFHHRVGVLDVLAPRLSGVLLGGALTAAQAVADPDARALTLADLARYLPEAECVKTLTEALSAARAVANPYDRAYTLADLVPRLPEVHQHEALAAALDAVRAITSVYDRADALACVAPHLPQILVADALAVATALNRSLPRIEALAGLVPHLPEMQRGEILAEALGAADAMGDPRECAWALAALVPQLPTVMVPDALDIANSIEEPLCRVEAFAVLAPRLPEAQRDEILSHALARVRTIKSPRDRKTGLVYLAPHLPEALFPEALNVARALEEPSTRAQALAALAPHLPKALLGVALSAARALEEHSACAQVVAALALRLPEAERDEILAGTLATAGAAKNPSARGAALTSLAPHLPKALLSRAIEAAKAVKASSARAAALAAFAPHLAGAGRVDALGQLFEDCGHLRRSDALRHVGQLGPVLAQVGGEELIRATVRAIRDTAAWWP